jgi:CTP synthase (UTP-ammonia lyase)
VLLISRLECAVAGQRRGVRLLPGTITASAYGSQETVEEFRCNFGLNPEYREQVEKGGLQVTGLDENGEVRIVELRGHLFFVATLFLPQHSSHPGAPHPLFLAFVKAAAAFRLTRASRIGAA